MKVLDAAKAWAVGTDGVVLSGMKQNQHGKVLKYIGKEEDEGCLVRYIFSHFFACCIGSFIFNILYIFIFTRLKKNRWIVEEWIRSVMESRRRSAAQANRKEGEAAARRFVHVHILFIVMF